MKILHLTLKKKWFDLILLGKKKIEYRQIKKHWNKRLWDSDNMTIIKYDLIKFVNGYGKDKPFMIVEFNNCFHSDKFPPENGEDLGGKPHFAIVLGAILETGNLKRKEVLR